MIWKILKTIHFKELWGLSILCVKHPLYISPSLKATKRCIEICDTLYGKTHHLHNPANAVRHALWNILIAQYCLQKNKDRDRVTAWTKLITDWHEDFSINEPLERAMDMHNNEIGRNLFLEFFDHSEGEIITLLQKKAENGQKVATIEEIESFKDKLVYLDAS